MPDADGRPEPIEKGGLNKGCRDVPTSPVPNDVYRREFERIYPDWKPWYERRGDADSENDV